MMSSARMRVFLAIAVLVALAPACATTPAAGPATVDDAKARAETVDVVRRSVVQRVLREAPAVTRGGVARLVTMIPLDDARVQRLAPAMGKAFYVERL